MTLTAFRKTCGNRSHPRLLIRASCLNRVAKCLAQPASNTGRAEASGGYLLTCGEHKEAKLKPIRCLSDQIFYRHITLQEC